MNRYIFTCNDVNILIYKINLSEFVSRKYIKCFHLKIF